MKGSDHEKSSSHRDGSYGCGSSDAGRLQERGTDANEAGCDDQAAGTGAEDHDAADHASACPCASACTSASTDDASACTGTSACTNEIAVA